MMKTTCLPRQKCLSGLVGPERPSGIARDPRQSIWKCHILPAHLAPDHVLFCAQLLLAVVCELLPLSVEKPLQGSATECRLLSPALTHPWAGVEAGTPQVPGKHTPSGGVRQLQAGVGLMPLLPSLGPLLPGHGS